MILLKIKELCTERSTTIAEIERTLKFSNGSVSKWGKSSPSVEKLKKVADYFGVSVDFFLTDDSGEKGGKAT